MIAQCQRHLLNVTIRRFATDFSKSELAKIRSETSDCHVSRFAFAGHIKKNTAGWIWPPGLDFDIRASLYFIADESCSVDI